MHIMTRTSISRRPIGHMVLLMLLACGPVSVSSKDAARQLQTQALGKWIPDAPLQAATRGAIFADGPRAEDGQCQYEVCGFDEFAETAPTTRDIGTCLQRPISEGGQGSEVQRAMMQVYSNVKEGGITVGHSGVAAANGASANELETALLDAINAAKAGASVSNSEGLYYCLQDAETGADAFYWVLNCNVLREQQTPDFALCNGLTPTEKHINGNLDAVAFVVDETLFGDDTWRRFVFNDQVATLTESQPIDGGRFKCSERPWFKTNLCSDPMAVTCPTGFEATTGRGAFQTYGDVDVVVVAQGVREWQLEACMVEPRNTDDGGLSVVAIIIIIVAALLLVVLLLVIAFLVHRLRKLEAHTEELEARGEVVPPISARLMMSSIIRSPSEVVEKARKESQVGGSAKADDESAEAQTSDEEESS